MAWIEGTHEETFTVNADYDDVVAFFCDPAEFKRAFNQMESMEEVEDGVWEWVLEEKNEKGIKFQGRYVVDYVREGDTLTWSTREGNMRSEGKTEITDLGGGQTEVHYVETLATDLPIPRLAAKIFKPIVAREIRQGVGEFLEICRDLLEE